jgi:hypothetical protein
MITGADSTLGVEASQETFQEMCEGIVKEVATAIYKETIPAKVATRMSTGFVVRPLPATSSIQRAQAVSDQDAVKDSKHDRGDCAEQQHQQQRKEESE